MPHANPIKLKRQQINAELWDACVEQSNYPLHYGLSWYLDIVSPNWEGLVWLENEQYLAVMPLPIRKKWSVFKYIHQPLFCQLTGVWTQDESLVPYFLEAISRYFSYVVSLHSFNTTLSLDVNKSPYNPNLTTFKKLSNLFKSRSRVLKPDFSTSRLHTHTLNLHLPYETIQKHYSPDRKLNLKRALKENWQIKESTDIAPMIQLFRENTEHKIKGGVGEWAYLILENLYKALNQRGLATLWYAIKEDKIEAGALFTIYKNRIIYLFNTASQAGRTGNSRTLMIDKMIQEYANKDFIFDFESPDNELIVDFYKSFGAEEEAFLKLSYESRMIQFLKNIKT